MARRERELKSLTVKISSVTDIEARKRLEQLYEELQSERAKAVEAARRAELASRKAGSAFIEFLLTASEHLPAVKVEPIWTTFRNRDGEIVLECPFTESDQRNAMRAQRANVEQTARSLGAANVETLYEGEDDGDKPIGFGAKD